uniref:Uncharacterized protein n=1 Tax=Elaeophora elaphi TaxID=1147741 RepID=A0A0R3S5A7_9BILA
MGMQLVHLHCLLLLMNNLKSKKNRQFRQRSPRIRPRRLGQRLRIPNGWRFRRN